MEFDRAVDYKERLIRSNIKILSMSAVTPESSLRAWRNYLAEVYYSLDVVTAPGEPVRGALREARLRSVCVSHLETNARKVIRRTEVAKADATQDFVFIFPRHGPLRYQQRQRHGTALPGDVITLTSAEYYAVESLGWTEHVTIKIPCERLRARLRWVDDYCARPYLDGDPMVPVVSSFALQTLTIKDPAVARRLEEVCLNLITVMLDARHGSLDGAARSSCVNEILLRDLRGFLQKNFADPSITVDDAARACRVSVRSVQRLYKSQNTTFGRQLLEMRLQHADRLLRSGSHRLSTIARVAELCGFSNQAHFATCYRRRFEVTPREARNLVV